MRNNYDLHDTFAMKKKPKSRELSQLQKPTIFKSKPKRKDLIDLIRFVNRNGKNVYSTDVPVIGYNLLKSMKDMILKLKNDEKIVVLSGVHGKPDGLNWNVDTVYQKKLSYKPSFDFDECQLYEYKNKCSVINMAGIKFEDFAEIVHGPNHVVLAYCFSRNDVVLRYLFGFDPVHFVYGNKLLYPKLN